MSRIPLRDLAEAEAAAEAAGVPTYMAQLSVFRVLLHHPDLARAMNDLLARLLFGGELDARLRELAIMRVGWVEASCYEWTQHWAVALRSGCTEDELAALRGDWREHGGFGAAERAVLAATDETLAGGTIGEATWAECERTVGSRQALIELVVAIGHWRMYATMLRSLAVPLEDGVEAWPPDGRAPTGGA